MSSLFDGREIWSDRKVEPVKLTKEQEERWERIQAQWKEVAAFRVQFAEEEVIRRSTGYKKA